MIRLLLWISAGGNCRISSARASAPILVRPSVVLILLLQFISSLYLNSSRTFFLYLTDTCRSTLDIGIALGINFEVHSICIRDFGNWNT